MVHTPEYHKVTNHKMISASSGDKIFLYSNPVPGNPETTLVENFKRMKFNKEDNANLITNGNVYESSIYPDLKTMRFDLK